MSSTFGPPGLPNPGRCLVMGVVNVTPDSFSDGGRWFDAARAIEHGLEIVAAGADIVDVGGESTRPGAQRVTLEEELRRVMPVVTELARQDVVVSVDTMRAEVADQALAAGARLVNDVSGGLADPAMVGLVAESGTPYVLMHWRGHSHAMYDHAHYDDVVLEVRDELRKRMDSMIDAGVEPEQLVLDPGLGFAKRAELSHNWQLLTHLPELATLGRPLLVGASRKRFLGRALTEANAEPRDVADCDAATVAVTTLAADRGAWCVRVHNVGENADAVRIAAEWNRIGASIPESASQERS